MYLVGAHEVRLLLSGDYEISRQRSYQITHKASFPKPVADLAQGPVWDGAEVKQWIAEHRTASRS